MNKKIHQIKNTESLTSRPSVEDYYKKQDAETNAVYCVMLFGFLLILATAVLTIEKFQ